MPRDLAERFATPELQRSLGTKDPRLARQRCLLATAWFREMVEILRRDTGATRSDLDRMAERYFASRIGQIDERRLNDADGDIAYQLELTRSRIEELDEQLKSNEFDPAVSVIADKLLKALETTREAIAGSEALYAEQAAARAERQQLRYLAHQLTTPTGEFHSDDFRIGPAPSTARANTDVSDDFNLKPMPSLREAAMQLMARKQAAGRGASHISELKRALGWLQEVVGGDRPIDQISKSTIRSFRDDLGRIDTRHRGQALPFLARLTDDTGHQIKSATSQRYWRSIRMFFAFARDELDLEVDPTSGLRMEARAGQRVDSPEAFDLAEVARLLSSPLFVGHAPGRRRALPGEVLERDGYWWSAILALFTGARAGELNQLLPSDFIFDAPIPYIRITTEDAAGDHTKKVKNLSSVRDIPMHDTLLKLGLRGFVETRDKQYPGRRILREFKPGTAGRRGEGLTRFWAKYLTDIGLKKLGRATHVFRHTVTAVLRSAGIAEEDIQAVLGHRRNTVTAGYGGAYPLSRKATTVGKIDFGFDVVEAVGGPFDKHRHGI